VHLPEPWMLGAFYGCSEIMLAITRRSGSANKSRDRCSLAILWIVIGIAITFSIFAAEAFHFASLPYSELYVAGSILFVLGIVLRWWSIIHLGCFFTVDVSIAAQHKVIDSGPYRFVRHPSYSGAVLAFLGFGLCLRNWISLLVLLLPIFAAFHWRIRVEERALGDALGEDYRAYARRTKRLVPFIY
jgi:protein-S-isoprenylcysteine O-methyltransferase